MSCVVSRVMFVNGPEPTGLEFLNVAGLACFDQMCFGTTNCRFRLAAMNCESGVFSVMATVFAPFCLIDTMFVPSRYRPMMSMALSCLPAVRL